MLVGISGFIGSGKDTVADYLVTNYQYKQESFANSLKDAIALVFNWDRTMLAGLTNESRNWREQVDKWWATRLNIPHLTPRWILQQWGTEVCRQNFHDDIWIASVENKIRQSTDNFVISDVRFPNEILSVKRMKGITIWVKRGELPNWYQTALDANLGNYDAMDEMERLQIHPSEWSWIGSYFDYVIENNSSKEDLYRSIDRILLEIRS